MRHRVFEDGEDDKIDKYDIQVCLNYHKEDVLGTSLSSIISLTPIKFSVPGLKMKFWSE